MPILVEAVGTVQAIASIQIKPRLDSQIMKVHVEEGALVKEGDMLFELDQRSLKAQLAQIEAQIRKDQAQVAQAKRDSSRAEDLLDKGAATVVDARHQHDDPEGRSRRSSSPTRRCGQNILTQLSFTEIRAPVSGRIGSIPYKVGTTVRVADNTATAVLATINQVDPIYVQFAIPQVYLPDLRAAMAKGKVTVNAVIDETHKQSGFVAFIENTVDPMTGTVMAKAQDRQRQRGTVARPVHQGRGRAGRRAGGAVGARGGRPARPAGSLRLRRQGRTMWPRSGRSASSARRAAKSVIGSGLKVGEQVVTDGQLRLVNGAAVTVKPAHERGRRSPPRRAARRPSRCPRSAFAGR